MRRLTVAFIVAMLAACSGGDDSKEVDEVMAGDIDLIVAVDHRADAINALRDVLDGTDGVVSYGLTDDALPLITGGLQRDPECAAFALVQIDREVDLADLRDTLGTKAEVTEVGAETDRWDRYQAEIFMHVDADAVAVAQVKSLLTDDDDVKSFEYYSKTEAYEEFKRIFEDEPALIESTRPEILPESFRLELAAGVDNETLTRYEQVRGVDKVLVEEAIDIGVSDPGPTCGAS